MDPRCETGGRPVEAAGPGVTGVRVRAMFVIYLLVIMFGLAYAVVVGLTGM
jgi:hypothetical protein